MAISVSSLELLGSFKPYGTIASSGPSTPLLSAAFNWGGGRSIARRSFCKLRSVFIKSGIVSSAETEEKADKDDRHLIDNDPACAASSIHTKVQERDFTGTQYVPVYVYLPEGTINLNCELVDPDYLINQLRILKSINVDGVVVQCWWGIVEAHTPEQYNWSGYNQLFQIVRDANLKLQVVMSFHEFGGNASDNLHIPLPQWVEEIGSKDPDIFFTDREGRRNHECLTWGIDQERVLRGRIALQVYYDYMRSFRVEFSEFFDGGVISEIKIGLGPCGELRYPSHPLQHGWKYPGIGEFQCYDKYLMKSLEKEAQATGKPYWGRGPDNAGSYNSRPHETGFFCDKGDYESDYGQFFLKWYSQTLVDHLQRVLTAAKMAFIRTPLAVKLPCIHWWHHTASHAAEVTAGFCHYSTGGYLGSRFREKYFTAINIQYVESQTLDHHEDTPETLGNPQALFVEAQGTANAAGVAFGSENVLPSYDREGYNKILENAKPLKRYPNDAYICAAFSYFKLSPYIVEGCSLKEFEWCIKKMHGESVLDLEPCHEEEQ